VAAEAGFRARAGALTLMYMLSDAERSVLRTLLAEAATGTSVQEIEPPPGREDEYRLDLFNDAYLLEPADPALGPGTPIGPDTLVQPTPAGREFVSVAAVLEGWLRAHPGGPLEPGEGEEGGIAVAALLSGWSASVTHPLAAGPLTVAQACEAVPTLDDELIEAYIASMEEVGLLEAGEHGDGETRYRPTEWLRRSIAPLAAAARMELRHPPGDTAPIAVADVEAAFLLALPLARLPERVAGSCALVVELEEEVVGGPAALTAHVEEGRVVALEPRPDRHADARAAAPAAEWLDAVIDGARTVETSGERPLARHLVDGLHEALFGGRR
jgi:hypothetical protein